MAQEPRIHSFFNIDRPTAAAMLAAFDQSIRVDSATPIHGGMSTSNYCITADTGRYFLKIYAGGTGGVEPAMYAYLRERIPVPSLLYYDDSRALCPYPYAVLEYIDGLTLSSYIQEHHCYPLPLAREIGRMLACIHRTPYPQRTTLDCALRPAGPLQSLASQITDLLQARAGSRLPSVLRSALEAYLVQNSDVLKHIDRDFVLCHGDIGYDNIMLSGGQVLFIDFEYALADSRFRDIGKFFRNKSPALQQYITDDIRDAFATGYGTLPPDWLRLAMLTDIPAMLALLAKKDAPQAWADDIAHDIADAIGQQQST